MSRVDVLLFALYGIEKTEPIPDKPSYNEDDHDDDYIYMYDDYDSYYGDDPLYNDYHDYYYGDYDE